MTAGAFVLVLTGPAGAGKSTVAEGWARTCPDPAAHVSLDDVRRQLKSGYVDPSRGWTGEPAAQLALARRLAAGMATAYVRAGIRCVVDDAVFPDREGVGWPEWQRELAGRPHALVVLTAELDEVKARNRRRDPSRRVPEPMLAEIHGLMAGWAGRGHPVVDSTGLTVDETVEAVAAAIAGLSITS